MPPPRGRKTEAAAAATDVLISLPTDVLDDILARVGLRDAVRTSALSRAWTRRWESVHSIDLSADDGGMWKAPSAVEGILLRFPGRVRRFHVRDDKAASRRVNDWLPTLSRRGVESLRLKLRWPPTLHESVFSCSDLTVLDLSNCRIPYFPLDWGFPNLRSLFLSVVTFKEDGQYQLQEIIETCPLLEDLRVVNLYVEAYGDIEFAIRAPNLRRLTLSFIEGFVCILDELPRMHSAAIDMWDYVHSNFAELLAGLVQARNLQLRLCTADAWDDAWLYKIPRKLPCTFHNLKSLKLHMDFAEQIPIELIILLLKSAPNLQVLKIVVMVNFPDDWFSYLQCLKEAILVLPTNYISSLLLLLKLYNSSVSERQWEYEEHITKFLNAQWEDAMCANLRVVHMDGVYWLSPEMSFMQLILSKASLLGTLSLSYFAENETSMCALQRSNKASPQAQVLFKAIEGVVDYNMRLPPCTVEEM